MAEPVRVGALLGAIPGMAERLAGVRLVAAWPTIAGPLAAQSRALAVEEGVLWVAVPSAGWRHRLTLEEPRLLTGCRTIAPIRGIRFRLAPPVAPPVDKVEGEASP